MKELFAAFIKAARNLCFTAVLYPMSWVLSKILGETPKTALEIARARYGWTPAP